MKHAVYTLVESPVQCTEVTNQNSSTTSKHLLEEKDGGAALSKDKVNGKL